eukprot:6960868-Prymnesium_polylepis.1
MASSCSDGVKRHEGSVATAGATRRKDPSLRLSRSSAAGSAEGSAAAVSSAAAVRGGDGSAAAAASSASSSSLESSSAAGLVRNNGTAGAEVSPSSSDASSSSSSSGGASTWDAARARSRKRMMSSIRCISPLTPSLCNQLGVGRWRPRALCWGV